MTTISKMSRKTASALGVLVAVLASTGIVPQAALADGPAGAADGSCQSVTLAVALGAGQPAGQTVSATYCTPAAWAAGPHEVDVMTPGATYDRAYWKWPVDPARYSYLDKTLAAGRAAFDYDRIGTGASSHPLSTDLTIDSEAYVLHQIVTWLRTDQGYDQVNLIGHSLGSVISIQEAGQFQDVSRVVVTGLLHVPGVGAGFASTLASLMYPAALDPQFAAARLDPGYLTTLPGARAADFFSAGSDPAVIGYDEAHKDVVPVTDLATLATTWALPPGLNVSDLIAVPVLVVIGGDDAIFCTDPPVLDCSQPGAILAAERPYYASAPSLTVYVVPGSGHDIALEPSADESFAQISAWIAAP